MVSRCSPLHSLSVRPYACSKLLPVHQDVWGIYGIGILWYLTGLNPMQFPRKTLFTIYPEVIRHYILHIHLHTFKRGSPVQTPRSSTNPHAPYQGHVNPGCRPRDLRWLAMEYQSTWFQAWWLWVWPRFEPLIPHQVETQFIASQPFPVSASGLFPSPTTAPVLCWCGKCQHRDLETMTVREYPLQLGCQTLSLKRDFLWWWYNTLMVCGSPISKTWQKRGQSKMWSKLTHPEQNHEWSKYSSSKEWYYSWVSYTVGA